MEEQRTEGAQEAVTEEVAKAQEAPREQRRENKAKAVLRKHFTAPRMAYIAIFTALAFVVSLFEFPVFPQAGFLKLDFANVFFMIEGFMFGPVEAFVSIGLKELLSFAKSSSGGVGQLANFLMSTAYVLVPAVAYRLKRGKWWVLLYLAIACAVQTGVSLLVNRYINFPFFMGAGAADNFANLWTFVLYFNIIKSVAISAIVFLIYKPLSKFINMTAEKFEKRAVAARKARREAKTSDRKKRT